MPYKAFVIISATFAQLSRPNPCFFADAASPYTFFINSALCGNLDDRELFPFRMERAMGIEPTYPAWEAGILPLNYARFIFL